MVADDAIEQEPTKVTAGNGIYVIDVLPAGTGPLANVRARYRDPATGTYREHAWSVPYNGAATALEQAPAAMRLAVTASAFSEWLAASPYAAEVTPARLLNTLSGVPQTFAPDPTPQKLEWMIRQAKSLSGR